MTHVCTCTRCARLTSVRAPTHGIAPLPLTDFPIDRKVYMRPGGGSSAKFYGWLVTATVLHEVAANCMFVAQMAFFSRISDPVIGGTYMTLLNTIANVGEKW